VAEPPPYLSPPPDIAPTVTTTTMGAVLNGFAHKIAERHGIMPPDFGGDAADDPDNNAGESRHLESGCQVAPPDGEDEPDILAEMFPGTGTFDERFKAWLSS